MTHPLTPISLPNPSLLGAIATLSLGLMALPAPADPGNQDTLLDESPINEEPLYNEPNYTNTCAFTVDISAGSLEGQEFYGEFSFDKDDLTGQGQETVTVDDGLQVSMYYLGRTYEATSDRNYPDYPRVILQDGKVELLDFWVDPRDRDIWWTGIPGWDVQLTQTDCEIDPPSASAASR